MNALLNTHDVSIHHKVAVCFPDCRACIIKRQERELAVARAEYARAVVLPTEMKDNYFKVQQALEWACKQLGHAPEMSPALEWAEKHIARAGK